METAMLIAVCGFTVAPDNHSHIFLETNGKQTEKQTEHNMYIHTYVF